MNYCVLSPSILCAVMLTSCNYCHLQPLMRNLNASRLFSSICMACTEKPPFDLFVNETDAENKKVKYSLRAVREQREDVMVFLAHGWFLLLRSRLHQWRNNCAHAFNRCPRIICQAGVKRGHGKSKKQERRRFQKSDARDYFQE